MYASYDHHTKGSPMPRPVEFIGSSVTIEGVQRAADRHAVDLCQDCWQELIPDQYAPFMDRMNECYRCGEYALVTRTAYADIADDGEES
jgi:hypothetical protein